MALDVNAIDARHAAALCRGRVGIVAAVVSLVFVVIAVGGVGAAALSAAGDGALGMSGRHSDGGSTGT